MRSFTNEQGVEKKKKEYINKKKLKKTLKLNVEANYPTCLLASMLSGTHLCVSFAKTIVECWLVKEKSNDFQLSFNMFKLLYKFKD